MLHNFIAKKLNDSNAYEELTAVSVSYEELTAVVSVSDEALITGVIVVWKVIVKLGFSYLLT